MYTPLCEDLGELARMKHDLLGTPTPLHANPAPVGDGVVRPVDRILAPDQAIRPVIHNPQALLQVLQIS